jgi:hypothetical protein
MFLEACFYALQVRKALSQPGEPVLLGAGM